MLQSALAAVPLFLLLGSLLFGRYPGCEAIVRLSERISARGEAKPKATRRPRRFIPLPSFAASGGLLIAFGHAQRPPPLAP